jgi:hypothetical protein
MKWFRSHIKHGSRLALLALAVQFVLSFGHFHGTSASAAPGFQPFAGLSELSRGLAAQALDARLSASNAIPQPGSGHDRDQHPGDTCDICAVMSLASAAMFATPPVLLLPQAVSFSYQATDTGLVRLDSGRVGFQPRAPPAS